MRRLSYLYEFPCIYFTSLTISLGVYFGTDVDFISNSTSICSSGKDIIPQDVRKLNIKIWIIFINSSILLQNYKKVCMTKYIVLLLILPMVLSSTETKKEKPPKFYELQIDHRGHTWDIVMIRHSDDCHCRDGEE